MPLLRLSSIRLYLIWTVVVRLASGQPGLTTTKTSFARTPLKYDAPRGKVSVAPEISVDDLEKIIEVHNRLRRQQGAADMELLKWHSFLATLAEEWVDLCNWGHGQLSQDPNVRSFQSVGQSMLASRLGSVDAGEVIKQWFHEEVNYDRETLTCRSGNLCKLYAQVVWSSSREVGCAIRLCDELKGLNWQNASFFICNYAPSGGWSQEPPFRIGKACTKCETGGLWCDKGLCNSFCQDSGLKCFCEVDCGCGKLNSETCSCNCGVGWHGPDCSEACVDRDAICGSGPSWSLSSCSDEDAHGRIVRRKCPATCRLCQAANSSHPVACKSVAKTQDADADSGQQHLTLPILLLLWTFAAAWMLTVQRINWNCSFRNQTSPPTVPTDRSTTWNLDSSGCSIDHTDLSLS